MLLPDCKYCSGFFAVICLLPFSLLLLPPLFPSCPAAVPVLPRCCFCLAPPLFLALFFLLFRLVLHCSRSAPTAVPAVVLSAAPAAPALFPWLFPPLFCRFLRRTSRAVPCALSRPGQHPDSPRSGHATRIGSYTKGRCKIALQRPRCRNVLVMPHPAGESYGRWPGKSCGGACPAYFAWAPVIPAWFGYRGGQAWTSTGYGFGRRRVSAPYFPTGALRSRLFSKGILPAATVFCTRNCGGRNPASSW